MIVTIAMVITIAYADLTPHYAHRIFAKSDQHGCLIPRTHARTRTKVPTLQKETIASTCRCALCLIDLVCAYACAYAALRMASFLDYVFLHVLFYILFRYFHFFVFLSLHFCFHAFIFHILMFCFLSLYSHVFIFFAGARAGARSAGKVCVIKGVACF